MYRLVDIPISNCLNSGYNQIFLLTQFNTASLHRHIREAYAFDSFGGGFVEVLAAEQTEKGDKWYQGTADAVRQNLRHMDPGDDDIVLILSGDQLYRMDYQDIIDAHLETGAEVTLAATPIHRSLAPAFGLMKVEPDRRITSFVEKPTDPKLIDEVLLPEELSSGLEAPSGESVLASMGIYVFSGKMLRASLDNEATDFGKEVIPNLRSRGKLFAHIFEGYWEDIGTIRAFFDANLRLTDEAPPFNFFDPEAPIFTRSRYLPPARIDGSKIERCIVATGVTLESAQLERCVIGVRSHVRAGVRMRNVIMMGAETMETERQEKEALRNGLPPVGVGEGSVIEGTILDANVRIGKDVRLSPEGKPDGFRQGDIYVRDGVMLVAKNGVVPDGTRL